MAFYEQTINDGGASSVEYRPRGGPRWRTDIAEAVSGYESRNAAMALARRYYDLAEHVLTQAQHDRALAFFHAMQGRAHGFRLRDWGDYQVDATSGILGTGVGTGYPTHQTKKRYTAGSAQHDRTIHKLAGAPVALVAGVPDVGASFNSNTGICTLSALSTRTITGITNANPGVITTSAPHGFVTGDLIYVSGVVGMTEVNGIAFTITEIAPTTFSIGVDTSGYGAWTSDGTAAKFPQPAAALRWTGEFDVPVRFDTDDYRAEILRANDDGSLYSLDGLPLIEIRV